MRRQLSILAAIALACAALAWGLSQLGGRTRPTTALGAAPEGSAVIAQVDVPALRASPIYRALAGEDAGLERISRACGFDPLDRVRSAFVFVVGDEGRPLEHVGFVARGELARGELVECVERVVEAEGGSLREVAIEGVPAVASAHGSSRAAFLGSDAVVGGDEHVVRALIRVDRGEAPGADRDAALARLWERVAARREVIAVAVVPPNWRDFLGRLGEGVELGALEDVRRIAVGARVRSGLGVTLALDAGDELHAAALVEEARTRIARLLEEPLLGISAAGSALRRIELRTEGGDAIATLDLDDAELASVVQLARTALDRRREAALRAAGARRGGERGPIADERLEAGGAAGAATDRGDAPAPSSP